MKMLYIGFWAMYIHYDKADICKHLCTNIKLSSYIIHAPKYRDKHHILDLDIVK